MSIVDNIRKNMGIVKDGPQIPAGSTPLADEQGVYGYLMGNTAHYLDGTLIGSADDLKEAEIIDESTQVGNFSAISNFGPTSKSNATAPVAAKLEDLANSVDNEIAGTQRTAIIANAMNAVAKAVTKVKGKVVNGPLILDTVVNTTGIFSNQQFIEDTLPELRMDMNRLLEILQTGKWPEYQTSPALTFQFNSSGALTVPASGLTAYSILPSAFSGALSIFPLAYKLVCQVVDTLVGSSQVQFYGSEVDFTRKYAFDKVTSSYVFMPRTAGGVNAFVGGAISTVAFDGLDTSRQAITLTANTTPAVSDDYEPAAGAVVISGVNVLVQLTPYIPTREDALNLAGLIRQGANANIVADAIAKMALASN
jgi:hypothetical protein